MDARPGRRRRGLRAVRLRDVPERTRLDALDKLLRTHGTRDGTLVASFSLPERLALGAAAHRPSDRVYWVSVAAYERVLAREARR